MYKFIQESKLESILNSEIKKLGGRSYKWVSPGNIGVPDRIIILKDMSPIFVELKTDKGRLSEIQKVQIRKLKDLGQTVKVIYGVKGLIEFFKNLKYLNIAERLEGIYGIHTS